MSHIDESEIKDQVEIDVSYGKDTPDTVISMLKSFMSTGSKQSKQVQNAFSAVEDVIHPPIDFLQIAYFAVNNTWHAKSIQKKAEVATSSGFTIKAKDGFEVDEHRIALAVEYLNRITSQDSENIDTSQGDTHSDFESFLEVLAKDLESLGNFYFEIIRSNTGEPIKLYHMPASTVRRSNIANGYWQLVALHTNHYSEQHFDGTGRTHLSNMSGMGGEDGFSLFGGGQFHHVFFKHWGDKRPLGTNAKLVKDGNPNKLTNEVIHEKSYHPCSTYYGIPDWIPAMGAVLSDEAAEQWNLKFFRNNRIPRWMFVFNQKMTKEKKDVIKMYFEQDADSHMPLVIALGTDGKVEATPLEKGPDEASFLKMREQSRDEIIAAHGVPPRMIGIISPGKMGGEGDARNQRKDFKNFTIQPLQKKLVSAINRQILPAAGFNDLQVVLNDFDISDSEEFKENADSCDKLIKIGIISINEAREKFGMQPLEDDFANKHFIVGEDKVIDLSDENALRGLSETKEDQEEEKQIRQGVSNVRELARQRAIKT